MDTPKTLIHPTTFLPSLLRLTSYSVQDITKALHRLQDLYWPLRQPPFPIAISKHSVTQIIHDYAVPDSGYASAEEDMEEDLERNINCTTNPDDDVLEVLRTDSVERSFAIKWVNGFISRFDTWIGFATNDADYDVRVQLLDQASSLLSAFIGGEEDDKDDGDMTRSFSFSLQNGPEIKVELNDASLLDNDHTSVGLQSWGSAIRLSERLCASPAKFSLLLDRKKPLRILELGAGTGLLSIVVAKILCEPSLPVIATDYHPDVLANLNTNVVANFSPCVPAPVIVHMLDWESPVYSSPLDEEFDIILAADVIYHPNHAQWIKKCIERLLARPNVDNPEGGIFWMMVALRPGGRHQGLDDTVDAIFPSISDMGPTNGLTLAVLEMEEETKLEGIGRVDESGYKLYKIGWRRL